MAEGTFLKMDLKLDHFQVIFTIKLAYFMILAATLAKWLAL